jgi:uncharacterized protein (DUF488 family)
MRSGETSHREESEEGVETLYIHQLGETPADAATSRQVCLLTIGHSNRAFDEFWGILKAFEVRAIADVRRYPSSRKFPHFNREALWALLDAQGIHYVWFEALGGHRHTGKNEDSPNTGLKTLGFRNYADYMMTDEFQAAAHELRSLAESFFTAVMCAERLYWKCHRRLLSDFLVARGAKVAHILERGSLRLHKLTPWAIITEEGKVIYPEPSGWLAGEDLRFGDH